MGYPIQDVIAQWGPPSSTYIDEGPDGYHRVTEHPIVEGQRVFRWYEWKRWHTPPRWEEQSYTVNGEKRHYAIPVEEQWHV
jgi:hypothetical protein